MGGRILIVEDNPANLELMTYLLTAFGHTVLTATDGQQGLEAIRRERPELVVCDVQIPVFDGYEVARQVKSDSTLRAIPMLAVTALAMVGDREKVLSAGFDGYLAKPIDPETFASSVARYLNKQRRSSVSNGDASVMDKPASRPAPSANRTILVVDDELVNLEFACVLLQHYGYDVVTAQSIQLALARARELRPALILSDVYMKQGSGYDLVAQIKADPQLRSIPFVFISSTLMSEEDRAKGLALGAARYLLRPIEPEVLLAEIQACLEPMKRADDGPPTTSP